MSVKSIADGVALFKLPRRLVQPFNLNSLRLIQLMTKTEAATDINGQYHIVTFRGSVRRSIGDRISSHLTGVGQQLQPCGMPFSKAAHPLIQGIGQ